MDKLRKFLSILLTVSLVFLIEFMFIKILVFYNEDNSYTYDVVIIQEATVQIDDDVSQIKLPYTFENLPVSQTVTLTVDIEDRGNEIIYVKTTYCPLKIYADGELIYEYGQEGTYPSFLKDPTVKLATIELPNDDYITLSLEYSMPQTRNDMELDIMVVGSQQSLFYYYLQTMGFQFITACFLSMLGIILILIYFLVSIFQKQSSVTLWLGLTAFLCGIWGFGESDLSGLLVRKETILYLAVFVGISLLGVPIQLYLLSVIKYKNPKPTYFLIYITLILSTISMVLQMFGILSFYQILPLFMLLAFVSIIFAPFNIFIEWKKYNNENASQFIRPSLILAFSALLEIINYIFKFSENLCVFVQIGTFIFIIYNGFLYSRMIKEGKILKEKNEQLAYENKLMEQSVHEQKKYHNFLMETRQKIREQRHDLRHQLAVIKGFADAGKLDKVSKHLENLNLQIPVEPKIHCENMAVNAIVGYYELIAREQNIALDIRINVPEITENISDNDLCVIFGNIIENAIEACERMDNDEKFIDLKSRVHNGLLIITQDNSFEGSVKKSSNKFYSSKREDFGIGIGSVQSIASKHSGEAEFYAENNIFRSSVYVKI